MPTFNSLKEYSLALAKRGREADEAIRQANRQLAKELTERSVEIMEKKIYAIPEKRGPSGKKLWVRKGWGSRNSAPGLIAEERFTLADQGLSIVHRNPTPYSIHRHNYGLPGHRGPNPPQLSVQWYEEAQRQLAWRIHNVRRQHLLELLRRG